MRYTPDPIKNEPSNIGLLLYSAGERYLDFWFDRDDQRLSQPDKDTLSHFIDELKQVKKKKVAWESAIFETIRFTDPMFMERLADLVGGQITFEQPRGCHSDNPEKLFDDLRSRFLSVRPSYAYAH